MHKYQKAMILLIGILLIVFITPTSIVANAEKTSTFQAQYEINNQKLYVSVPPSLYNYYGNQSHTINVDSDYANFVTPQAVAPIAESIQKVTDSLPYGNELFADAVLAFVHQIPYNVTDVKYPVETLVNNNGDCVGLSLLAASIMEAGGLSVVLILYTGINPQHMNVGVCLPYTPVYHTAGLAPTSFTYDNETYWTAESTNAEDWKVGDQPSSVAGAEATIIPLNNTTQSLPPAQVSASLTSLLPSTITVNPSQQLANNQTGIERAITIQGSIIPAMPNQTVIIYVSGNENEYNYYGVVGGLNFLTTLTDNNGNYNLTWDFTSSGTYYITASWNGASNYAGADSQTLPIFVGPQSYFQFEGDGYYYVFEQPTSTDEAVSQMQGVNNFLTVPLGANVLLSYSFIVLQAGQTISNVQIQTITVPASQGTVTIGGGRNPVRFTTSMPAYNETVPVNVPNGLEQFDLPSNFNQTINNELCFILQNNGEANYCLNVKAQSDDDLSNLQASAAIVNATGNIKQDTWYQITTKITDNTATTNISDSNGTLIESTVNPNVSNQTVLLITNNEDTAIALKNLTIQTQNTAQQPQSIQKPTRKSGNPIPAIYAVASILLAVTTTIVVAARLRRAPPPTSSQPPPYAAQGANPTPYGQPSPYAPSRYQSSSTYGRTPPYPASLAQSFSYGAHTIICPNCKRSVRGDQNTCPFCRKRLR